MSYKPTFSRGDWKVECDICGRRFKSSSMHRRWDGLMVCQEDWEPRNPQEFVRATVDRQVPAWTRPELTNVFIDVVAVTPSPSTPVYDAWGNSWSTNWGNSWGIQ